MIVCAPKLHANHVLGADISYRSLGYKKFEIVAHIYRNCSGIPFSSPSFGAFGGSNGGNGCGSYSLTFTRKSIEDITEVCPGGKKPCTPSNTRITDTGYEMHTYVYSADFTTSPLSNYGNSSCCEVTFYLGQCCRNGNISTGPAGNDFWATTTLNICNIFNSPATVDNGPIFNYAPILKNYCNSRYDHAWSCTDPDLDSVVYQLKPGISALPSTSVSFTSPFSAQYPVTAYCQTGGIKCTPNPKADPAIGFYFDTFTGRMVYTPTKCDEMADVCVRAYSYRKINGAWKFMGFSTRDISVVTRDLNTKNRPPDILAPDTVFITPDKAKQFDITVSDSTLSGQSVADTPILNYPDCPNLVLKKMTKSGRNSTYTFELKIATSDSLKTLQSLTFQASDRHCEKPLHTTKAIQISIIPNDTVFLKMVQGLCQNILVAQVRSKSQPTSFQLTYTDTLGNSRTIWTGEQTCFPEWTFPFSMPFKLYVSFTAYNQKNSLKTVHDSFYLIKTNWQSYPHDTSLCEDGNIRIQLKNPAGVSDIQTKWYYKGNLMSENPTEYKLFNVSEPTLLSYTRSDICGCSNTDTVLIKTHPKPLAGFTYSPSLIFSDAPTVQFINLSSIKNGTISRYTWNFGTSNPGDTSSAFEPAFTYPATPAIYLTKLTAVSNAGCSNSITGYIRIWNIANSSVLSHSNSGYSIQKGVIFQAENLRDLHREVYLSDGRLLISDNGSSALQLNPGLYIIAFRFINSAGEIKTFTGKWVQE